MTSINHVARRSLDCGGPGHTAQLACIVSQALPTQACRIAEQHYLVWHAGCASFAESIGTCCQRCMPLRMPVRRDVLRQHLDQFECYIRMGSPEAESWQEADPWEVAKCFDKTSPAARALRLLYGAQVSSKIVGNQYSDRNRDALRELQQRHAVQERSGVPSLGAYFLEVSLSNFHE